MQMVQIKFNGFKTYDDFGLILSSKKLSTPVVKSKQIDITGRDGVLDLTEYFDRPLFKNCKNSYTFTIIGNNTETYAQYSAFRNFVQGKRMKIEMDIDYNCYRMGRVHCGDINQQGAYSTFTVDCDCDPYKYNINLTIRTDAVQKKGTVLLYQNLYKPVIPKITLNKPAQIEFNNTLYSLTEGSHLIEDIVFTEGVNTIKVNTVCQITVSYQEGGL